MIYVPHHTKNSKIHDDIRTKPGNRVVVFKKKRHVVLARFRRYFFSKVALSSLIVIGIVIMSSNISRLKADEVIFYPTACLGGFDSPKLAEHKPDTSVDASKGDFDEENSAFLSKTKNAELYCGNFDGDVNEGTAPKSIVLTVHMSTKDTTRTQKIDGDSSQQATVEALDGVATKEVVVDGEKESTAESGEREATPSEKNKEVTPVSTPSSEEKSADTPAPSSGELDIHAYLPIKAQSFFFQKVFAEEVVVGAPEEVVTPPTPPSEPVQQKEEEKLSPAPDQALTEEMNVSSGPLAAPSSQKSEALDKIEENKDSATPHTEEVLKEKEGETLLSRIFSAEEKTAPTLQSTSSANAAFEIRYSTGNDEWTSLALLSDSDTKTLSLALPYTPASWKDLSTFQIMIRSLENFDERKDLFVDGMELHISYGPKDGIEKQEEREYYASNIENKTEGYSIGLVGEKGERQFLSLQAKDSVGAAFYSLDTESMIMSTSVSSATSTIDPNGSLPEYGSFAVVFTQDQNWCNGKSLTECVKDDNSVGVSYFSLLASIKKGEGKDIVLKKKSIESELLHKGEGSTVASTSLFLDQSKNLEDTQHTQSSKDKGGAATGSQDEVLKQSEE